MTNPYAMQANPYETGYSQPNYMQPNYVRSAFSKTDIQSVKMEAFQIVLQEMYLKRI